MKVFIPDMYCSNIYEVPYDKLKKRGIKLLLFDVDNTCVGYREKIPNQNLEKLMKKLIHMKFQVILFSNASKKRLRPFETLPVVVHPFSKKPFRYHFLKVMKKYHCEKEEVCIIGDQLFTDILGGHKVGIMTCLVDPLTDQDFILTKVFRVLEKVMLKSIHKHLKKEG